MARGGLVIAGVAVVAIAGLALAASEAQAAPGPGRRPPPPPPNRTPPPPTGGGGGSSGQTPMQIAKQHPNYNDWLFAAQRCDEALASEEPWNSPFLGFCEDAAYFANVMTQDGVPPGKWR